MKYKWLYFISVMLILNICGSISTGAEEISTEKEIPYLFKITNPDYPVYTEADYESDLVGSIQMAGVFTIIEEKEDDEGDLWGKLKSGMGWVNLTDTEAIEDKLVKAAFITETEAANLIEHHKFVAEESEYISWILFETENVLTDITLELLEYEYTEETYKRSEILYELSELSTDKPLVAGVVYWGDMTTYGISFKDGEKDYSYALYMSGKDGSLIMEAYEPCDEKY